MDQEFLKRLRATFQLEAEEHIQNLSSALLSLEKGPEDPTPFLEVAFRSAHSLKGAARAVNFEEIEELCQTIESLFARWKKGEEKPAKEAFDRLYQGLDGLSLHLAGEEIDLDPLTLQIKKIPKATALEALQKNMEAPKSPPIESPPHKPSPEAVPPPPPTHVEKSTKKTLEKSTKKKYVPSAEAIKKQTVRITTQKLDTLFSRAEEMISAKLAFGALLQQVKQLVYQMDGWASRWEKVRPLVQREKKLQIQSEMERDESSQEWDFLEWNGDQLKHWKRQLRQLWSQMEHRTRSLENMVDQLLKDAKEVLMLPCSILLEGFPKIVRDLNQTFGKEVDLEIQGQDISLDKRVLEELKDPLIHLVRNALDHGMEPPEDRKQRGKSPRGRLEISVIQAQSDRVEIEIRDDGRGIDTENLKEIALKKNLFSKEKINNLSDEEALDLIFHSGFSTAPLVTHISGRGLGMAIVLEKIEKLGGSLSVDTRLGEGTSFRMVLPLTLATFRAVVVQTAGQTFVLPLSNVEQVIRAKPEQIKTVENRPTLEWQDGILAVVSLGEVLGLGRGELDQSNHWHLAILRRGNREVAFQVDQILGEQEVLVKGLGPQLLRVPHIAGAALLGTGKAVPLLHVMDLLDSASGISTTWTTSPKDENAPRSILIAEDSMTSRMLLKNILEVAGYRVTTSVDGAEALEKLRSQSFDMLVSDVEMPRMDGFELTQKVRQDKKLTSLPVVLVTSLHTNQDQEKGLEAGANAYVVKSGFDQENLLDIIERLIL